MQQITYYFLQQLILCLKIFPAETSSKLFQFNDSYKTSFLLKCSAARKTYLKKKENN